MRVVELPVSHLVGISVLLVLFLGLGTTTAFTSPINPGFRAIVTQKGLNYADAVAIPLLKEKVEQLKIPDIQTSFHVAVVGTVDFSLTDATIDSLDFGDSSLTSSSSGVTLTDNGISLSISADWSYRQENWPHFKDSGTVDISGNGISLELTVDITMNKTSGGIHLNCDDCSINVNDLSVKFHGGASWLYNLFSSEVEGQLKNYINSQVCSSLQNEINTAANIAIDKLMNVTYPVWDGLEIDYGLVSDPDFSHPGYIIINSKGEFKMMSNPQDPPFAPPPLPDPSLGNYSKMFHLQGTTYIAESASWALWKAGVLSYNVSNDKIPTGFKKTGFYCDIVSPELCKKYPNMDVMFGVMAVDYPRLKITPDYAVITGIAHASMYVNDNGRIVEAFTLQLDAQADVKVVLTSSSSQGQYAICGNVSNPKINLSLAHSNIGNFNCTTLTKIVTQLAPSLGLAYINKYLNTGIPIPTIEGFTFVKPTLTFGTGYIEVSGDVNYTPEVIMKLRKGFK